MNIRDEFLKHHMVHLKSALPPALCEEWVADYFARTGIDESDPSTIPDDTNGFAASTRTIPIPEASPMAWDAICELLGGEDKTDERTRFFSNGFNLNYNLGADEPWQGPSPDRPGWHKDGWFFRHFLDSPDGNYNALEASILQALDIESLDFQITRERKRSEGFSRLDEE